MRKYPYLIPSIVLLIGLAAAVPIYLTAGDDRGDVLGYEMAGGQVYPVNPGDSKLYMRDIELYGGKTAVLMDELRRGFDGLWHGKALAFTVAGIAALVSAGLFFILPPGR